MALLLLDLDNTLVNRTAGFRAWAEGYLIEHHLDPALIEAMMVADADGWRPKTEVATDLARILGLPLEQAPVLIPAFRAGIIEHLSLVPDCHAALTTARRAGWSLHILTNGTVAQQRRKIEVSGLADWVDGWTISDEVGLHKPDPAIYQLAATRAGMPLAGAWMIGDAEADVVGARAAGIDSVYLSRGRTWPALLPQPSAVADSLTQAVQIVVNSAPTPH